MVALSPACTDIQTRQQKIDNASHWIKQSSDGTSLIKATYTEMNYLDKLRRLGEEMAKKQEAKQGA